VSYFTLGAACSEVEVDVLSGEVVVHRTDILFDAGHSMNPVIDIGQAEGAFVMGQGFFTQEETIYQRDGTLTTDSTWEYKPPLANQIPTDFRVELLKDSPFPQVGTRRRAARLLIHFIWIMLAHGLRWPGL
jgi:xanthine dehydrogenase molybdopterin-binding subunit B